MKMVGFFQQTVADCFTSVLCHNWPQEPLILLLVGVHNSVMVWYSFTGSLQIFICLNLPIWLLLQRKWNF